MMMSANAKNLSGFPSDLNKEPVFGNIPKLRNIPLLPVYHGLEESKANEQNIPQNHFYGGPPEKFLTDLGQHKIPAAPAEKRFLVFDQSGDKTTLMYTHWSPKPPINYNNLIKEGPRYSNYPPRPSTHHDIIDDTIEYNSKNAMPEEETHEDTEELNALLCSDNETDSSEDDEETSTGHSPSTMTDNGVPDLIGEFGEEVDSFCGPTKKRKLINECSVLEDDGAEYSYIKNCKRSRKENINETVSVLKRVIPGVNGKDAIVVLDEAIRYLRSLKVKAEALGLDVL